MLLEGHEPRYSRYSSPRAGSSELLERWREYWEGWVWRDLTVAGVWSFKIWDTPRILAQIAAGTLPVERVVTSRIGMRDVVPKGIQRLADPGGDQVKILVSATGQEGA